MCGVCGFAGETIKPYLERRAIEPMIGTLKQRGPDAQTYASFKPCVLGSTRLSIIDHSTGSQPMKDNAQPLCIAFNGEIYNYRELKEELKTRGHVFSTNSDTEVILKSYIEFGNECPKYLDGMFAFAIWNEERKELFLARDRFGKKPLYYALDSKNNIIFGSEIKAIFASGGVKGVVDPGAIDNYLTLLYVPPWKTVYKNISVIPPAHCAVWKNGRLELQQYWSLEIKPLSLNFDNAKDQLRQLLNAAVKKRLIADVEVATFLSGGIDSSIITCLAQKNSKQKMRAFSAGFGDAIDELPFAREAAKAFHVNHQELQIQANLIDTVQRVCAYFDEPFADSSSIPTYLLSKATSAQVKVALSGDGADELFMGYGWYRPHNRIRFNRRFFSDTFKYLRQRIEDPYQRYLRHIQYFNLEERNQLWQDPRIINSDYHLSFSSTQRLSTHELINYFDLNAYLQGDILVKADRASMMASLEMRSPFLDHHLAEFVYNLPLEYKTNAHTGKVILREAFKDMIPQSILTRGKHGFGAPIHSWLKQQELQNLIHDSLLSPAAHVHKYFNIKYINAFVNNFYQGNSAFGYKLWTLLCLELWFKEYAKYQE